jgi:predicted RNA methylase
MQLIGYNVQTKLFLFHLNGTVVTRYYEDIKKLDRWHKKITNSVGEDRRAACLGFPVARFSKLSKYSWDATSGVGYHVEMKKSLIIVNEWLTSILNDTKPEYQNDIKKFTNEESYQLYRHELSLRCIHEKRMRELQQYFTLNDNIETLVNTTFEYLLLSNTHSNILNDTLFIEPSCGDGRVIKNLMAKGCKNIVGYEIDEEIIRNIENIQVKSKILTQDFTAIDQVHVNGYKNSVLIGNPPFADQQKSRLYPLEFILKGIIQYRVNLVAFILPTRCNSSRFLTHLLDQIHVHSSSTWKIINTIDIDPSFEFNGRIITQPSILLTLGAGS